MNIATPTEPTQLVTIPADTAYSVFTADNAVDPILARVRKEIDALVPDITTAKGRKAVASMAYTISQTKSYLEEIGKALAAEQKEIPKKIDASRKKLRDTLDAWRDEVRKPLTDYEAAEEARIKAHTDAITALNELSRTAPGRDSAGLRESLDQVEAVVIGPACEEFEADYARAKDAARAALTAELPKAETREAEAEELIRLRAESDARAVADREEKIRHDAAAAATLAAETEAQCKLDAKEAEAQAARDAEAAATKRAEETESRLLQEAADKKASEEAEVARREADTAHRASIHRAAVHALVAGGLTGDDAKKVVILIATRQIPAISILY